jgi:acyl-CoA synthetase (AMP-forming)/AMP-acid ligase II/acyl carrier protein
VSEDLREEVSGLDLSHWDVAVCGAEPIHIETLEKFAAFYGPAGFKSSAFAPCYGLAEATLIVTGSRGGDSPLCMKADPDALAGGCAREPVGKGCQKVVGCGEPVPTAGVAIVHPDTRLLEPEGVVGEIWVDGPSVAAGYWGREGETEATFQARTMDGQGPYLRTGDLGFTKDGQLYVVGRRKEMIIVHGRNIYPQDVERTVRDSHPALASGVGAAFAVQSGEKESLVIVQEVDRKQIEQSEQIFGAILGAVWASHEVEPHAIVLAKRFGVPRTSSGKVRRLACREQFEGDQVAALARWNRPERSQLRDRRARQAPSIRRENASSDVVKAWLVVRVAELSELDASAVDSRTPFSAYGFDSIRAVQLANDLAGALDLEFEETLLWDYPNIDSVANYVAERIAREERELSAEPCAAGAGRGV